MGDSVNIGGDADNVRNMISGKPYRLTALEYHRRGWYPIPLPPRDKFPPPEGTTGRKNPIPDDRLEAVTAFLADGFVAKVNGVMQHYDSDVCNIGLRMDQTVIGLDVDNYDQKNGYSELTDLEAKLGKLPSTWVSSARMDGASGIRFFRIPERFWPNTKHGGKHGLSFSGKAANAIEVVQYSHRYAAVGPSWHPKAKGEYRWFAPGEPLDKMPDAYMSVIHTKNIRKGTRRLVRFVPENTEIKIPRVWDLPDLPDAWIEHLTRGFVQDDLKPRDVTSTERDLLAWAAKKFPGGKTGAPCKTVRKAAETHKSRMKDEESSHDKIIGMHWNILLYALDGHRGALRTSQRLETVWRKTVLKGNTIHGQKRGLAEANSEMFRSRVEALRKIKGMADEMEEAGADPFRTGCTCADEEEIKRQLEQRGIPTDVGKIKDLEEYDNSDLGRAEMYRDMFTTERIKCVGEGEKTRWFFWKLDGTEFGWRQDNDLADRLMISIVQAYKTKYEQLRVKWRELKASGDAEEAKDAGSEMRTYREMFQRAGNVSTSRNCLTKLSSFRDIRVAETYFDSRPEFLGFDDGLIELAPGQPWRFRQKEFDDRVSLSVGRPFEGKSLRELVHGRDVGVAALQDYQKTFVPDRDLWAFLQMLFGYSLYGANPERLIFFFHGESSTGKSTIVNAICDALGPYAGSSNSDIFNEKDGGRNPELIKTRGKRIVQMPEFGEGSWISNDSLKRLASEDTTSVRDNYAKSDQIIEFVQTATYIGPTNSVPRINGIDSAVRRRVCAVPFDMVFGNEKGDTGKSRLLRTAGRDAVLAWALEGWNRYVEMGEHAFEHGNWPQAVRERTQEFIGEMSSIGEFVQDYIQVTDSPKDRLFAKFVFSRYQVWADTQGMPESKRMDQRKLSKAIADFTGKKTTTQLIGGERARGWAGIKLIGGTDKVSGRGFETTQKDSG